MDFLQEGMKVVPPIVQEGEKGGEVLRVIAPEVPEEMFGGKELKRILADMSAAMRLTSNGVAIAAPQIGISFRIFVVRGYILAGMNREDKGADKIADVAFINPQITEISKETKVMEEGCLSCQGYSVDIRRAIHARLRAQNKKGGHFEMDSAEGAHTVKNAELLAEIFQHETDHLNGILCIDNADVVFKKIGDVWHVKTKEGTWKPLESIEPKAS